MARSDVRHVQAAPMLPRFAGVFRSIPAVCAGISVSVGLLVLVGWALNITALESVFPGYVTMKPNSALCFVAFGVALWLFSVRGADRRSQRIALLLTVAVAVLCLLTLSEYLFGWDLRIDQVMFHDASSTHFPGRMSAVGAIEFILLSGAQLLLIRGRPNGVLPAQALALIALLFAWLAVLAYAYGVSHLGQIAPYKQAALHTAATFVVLAVGLLALMSGRGVMASIRSPGPGGLLVRRMLPLVVAIPCVAGWLIVAGYGAGWYNPRLGLALLVIVVVLPVAYGLFQSADHIDRMSEAQVKSEARETEAVARADTAVALRVKDGRQARIAEVEMETLLAEQTATLDDVTHRVLHDELTDLPNRTLIFDRLEHAIQVSGRNRSHFALLFMDLNGFKQVNDTLGHHAGDLLLREVALRLLSAVRESDTVARLSGDEFAILLPTADRDGSIRAAKKILWALGRCFVEDQPVDIGGSIGVALYPNDGNEAEVLMQHADVAMYVAKRDGAGYAAYSPDMN